MKFLEVCPCGARLEFSTERGEFANLDGRLVEDFRDRHKSCLGEDLEESTTTDPGLPPNKPGV